MAQRIPITSTPQTAEKTTTRTVKKTPTVFKAAISLGLGFVMFVEMIPPELVWAASDALASESVTVSEDVPYENTILFEDPSLREENKKEYRMSDGSYKAIVYPQPIHYEENGEWRDIDNTLSLDESVGGYTNSASDFTVTFAKKSSSKKLVEIKTDDYKLSWGFVGSNNNKSAKKKTKVTSDDITALNELSDGLYYNDIYNDVDVEYILQSKTLKENIILKTRDAQQTFELELKLNKATAVLNSDRTVSIILSDGTEAAKFAAPYMYDANGVQNTDVAVSLSGSGNKYTLTLTPSKEWLNDENRAYPVTIDPALSTTYFNSILSFNMLDGDSSIYDLYVGRYYNTTHNVVDTVYGFLYLSLGDWKNEIVQKASIVVDTAAYGSQTWTGSSYSNTTVNKKVAIQAIDHPFFSETEKDGLDKSGIYDIANISVDYSSASTATVSTYKFDITEYFYGDFPSYPDTFIMFQEYDAPATVSAGTLPVMFTNPRMEYDYRSPDGVEEYLTYTEASVGEAGTIYINDATGKVVYAHSGLTTPSVTMPISVGSIYQNGYWRTNFSETLYKYIGDETDESYSGYIDKTFADAGYPYSWVDSDGTEIFFHRNEILNDEGEGTGQYEIVDETGKRIVLKELSNGRVELTDTSKNVSLFAPYGENQYRLVSKTDPYGNYINVYYANSTSTQISSLENNYTEIVSLIYDDDGRLIGSSEIYSYMESVQSVTYSYDDSGNLTEITRPDGKKTKLSYSGNKLAGVLDVSSGYMVRLIYENNKITLKEYANVPETMDTTSASEGQSMVMTFNGSSTSFRTPGVNGIMEDGENSDDILTVYQFDTYLRTVSAYSKSYVGNEFYGAEQQEYTSGGLIFDGNTATNGDQKFGFNKIKNTVSIGKNTENLLVNGSFEIGLPTDNSNPINYCGAQFDCNESVTGTGVLSDYVTSSIYTVSTDEDIYAGEKALKAEVTAAGKALRDTWYVPIARSTNLEPNTEYTFSAYVKCTAYALSGASLSVNMGSQEVSQYFAVIISDDWQRAEVRFTTPETMPSEITFCIKLQNTGCAYVDCVQLEKGPAANAYNYAENQGFENSYVWSEYADHAYEWTGQGNVAYNNTFFGNNSYRITGSPSSTRYVTQTITIANSVNQTEKRDFTVSAWAKADALPAAEHTPDRFFGIKARLVYEGNTGALYSYGDEEVSFNTFETDWQYAALKLTAKEGLVLKEIRITLSYDYQVGTCLFDNIGVAEGIVTDYEHDEKGNVAKVSQDSEHETVNTYEGTDLTSSVSKNGELSKTVNINQYDPYIRNDSVVTHTLNIDGVFDENDKLTDISKINSVTQYIRDPAGRTIYTQTGSELYAYLNFDNYCADSGPNGYYVGSTGLNYILREGTEYNYVAHLGAGDYIHIDDFIPDDHFSISFDVGLDYIANGDYGGQYFITRYDENKQEVFSLYNGGGIVAQFGGQLSNSSTQASDDPINVTITFEKVSDYRTIVRIYINGEFQNSQFIEATTNFSYNDGGWYIGAGLDEYGNITNKMRGWIDNLAFFRGVLSEAEIHMMLKGDYFTLDKRTETADWTEYTYGDNGRYLIKEEHSNGNTTDYTIDYKTGLTTSVLTTSRDGTSVRMNYEYNIDKSLKLVYYDSDNDGVQDIGEQFNRYNYDSKGNLVSVAHNGTQYTFTYNEFGQRTSAAAGSNTLATYTYPVVNDKAINATITGMTFGGDSTKSQEYIYDELGNKTGRKFGGTLKQEWEYDNKGNLVSEKDYEDGTNAWYQYDAKSRLSRSYKYHDSAYYIASSYAYDKNSNLSEVSHYINGSLTTNTSYGYDNDGRFTTANSGTVRAETAYNEVTDKLTTRKVSTVGSDNSETLIASETYSYYTSIANSGLKDAVKEISYNDNSKISYTYDSQGRIKTESRNGNLYVTYTYDKLGQLTKAAYNTLNQTHNFYYDNAGNITEKVIKQGSQILDSITYSYGNETWGDLMTSNGQYSILYDSMGNPIGYISQSSGNAPIDDAYLVWENGRELASINNKTTNAPIVSYEYNSSGLRTNKMIGTTDIARYLYDDNGNLISEQRSRYALTFYYDGNGVRTHFTHESEAGRHTYYYRYNLQGDVIALLDSTGTVVAEYNYTPYGEHIGTVTGIAADNPFRYRGYYYDNETGYYYLQSRYYNPVTCRFINADSVMSGVASNLIGFNLFAYCFNDPINMNDQDGNWPKWLTGTLNVVAGVAQMVTGMALGATVGWTGIGAVAAGFLIMNGAMMATQGIGQIVNDVTKSKVMREDNMARTAVTETGRAIGGEKGAKVAGAAYSAAELAANIHAGRVGLQQAGKLPVKVKVNRLTPNPTNNMTDEGINYWTKTLAQNGFKGYNTLPNAYGVREPISVQRGTMMIANGHHRVAVLSKYGVESIDVFLVP